MQKNEKKKKKCSKILKEKRIKKKEKISIF
jgi:hypothetical protein